MNARRNAGMRALRTLTLFSVLCLAAAGPLPAREKPIRVGTTAANFLEYGYGAAGSAMGDACVSVPRGLASVYWNPAGFGLAERNEAYFVYQPWLAGIQTSLVSAGVVLPTIGNLAFSLIYVNYGDMEVTTMASQEGTGAFFSAADVAASATYSRAITDWFAFGASLKLVSSRIWHMTANAVAVDLGVLIRTGFFSPTGVAQDGLNLGMSVSNYGTRMRYSGIDLRHPIDILPEEAGNFKNVPGDFHTEGWELPLIFRLGVSLNVAKGEHHSLVLAADALHPNNNSESVNLGAEETFRLTNTFSFSVRVGYKALFMEESQYGLSFGAGLEMLMFGNRGVRLDYAYRGMSILGSTDSFGLSVFF